MRSLLFVCLMTWSVPVLAQHDNDAERERTSFLFGFGYRSGSFAPALALSGDARRVEAGTSLLFAEARSQRGYAYVETTYPVADDRLRTHAFGAHGAMVTLFGFRLDTGLDYRYLSESATVFEYADTRIASVRRQHSFLFSLGGRWGSYEGFYLRHAGFIGTAFMENTLDLFVDSSFIRRNASDVDSGLVQLYGYRTEAGWSYKGIRLRGGATTFTVRNAPAGTYELAPIFFGTLSYTTPWRVGLYLEGMTTANTDVQHLTFLNDAVTFGITARFP